MASDKEYLSFMLEQLSGLDDISYRAMMGEYILYYRGRIIGGIYDNRFLIKPVKAAAARMPGAAMEAPYDGAKEMILVENVDDRAFLTELVAAMYDELPAPKKKKDKGTGKYRALWEWIGKNGTESFTLTFSEIEQIAGLPIDHSFLTYKKELEAHGFRVGKISMKAQTVAFARIPS